MAPRCHVCFVLLRSALWLAFMLLDILLGIAYYPIHWLQICYYRASVARNDRRVDSEQATRAKTVVVVGGNFAGLAAVRHLEGNHAFRVILVDQHEYFEYTVGVLRLICDASLFPAMAGKLPTGTHELVIGRVTQVSGDHVVVSKPGSGGVQSIAFDYIILAMGADYRQPITALPEETSVAQRHATWQREAAVLERAERVLVIGGGAVGTELAAEIVDHFPAKHVTIVTSARHLVPLFPRRTICHAEAWLQARGVELVFDTKVERWDDCSCTTQLGQTIFADRVFTCLGLQCNSQPVSEGDMASCLGARREIQVNVHLQVQGQERAFAAGDAMVDPSREMKQAYYAEMTGKLAARNVVRHLRGESLLRYPGDMAGAPLMPLVAVVSLGRHSGSLVFNNLVMNQGLVAALMKWVIEWTKIRSMEGRPVGLLVWKLGDAITFYLSRRCCRRRRATSSESNSSSGSSGSTNGSAHISTDSRTGLVPR